MEHKIETDSDEERSKKNEYSHPILLEPFENLENPVFDSEGSVRDKSEKEINKGIISRKPVIIIESTDLRKIQSDYKRKKDEQFEKIMSKLNEITLENKEIKQSNIELKQELVRVNRRLDESEERNRELSEENRILKNAQIPSVHIVNQHNKRVRRDEIYGSDNEDGMQNVPLMDKNSESRSWSPSTGLRDTFSIFTPRGVLTQEKQENELRRAAYNGDIDRLRLMLSRNKNIVNGRGMPDSLCSLVSSFKDKTALMLAAREGHFECVRELLKNGANVNLWDRDSRTALDYAQRNRRVEIAKLLVEYNAPVGVEIKELNKDDGYKHKLT